jgi:hypothetical protein
MDIYTSNIPYTYLIQWSKTGMKYYGVRYGKNCQPEDFWVSYFTSSISVAEYISQHGEPDIIQIRKTFLGNSRVSDARLWEHKVLRRLKVIERSDFLNKSDSKSIDPAASSKARTGVSPGNKGKPQPEYIKDKKRKPKPLVECPHCNKIGGISAMTRWHFDKCGTDANKTVSAKIAETNRLKNLRPVIVEIQKIRQTLSTTQKKILDNELRLKTGWYQFNDNKLASILNAHKEFICRP